MVRTNRTEETLVDILEMKVQVFSDIHLEAYHDVGFVWKVIKPQADVAIVAGDIHSRRFESALTEIASKFKKVFCVLGNHEFYHRDISWRPDKTLMPDNVTLLDNTAERYEGVLFVGNTLWTDFDNADHWIMKSANNGINDFSLTMNGAKRCMAKDVLEIHYKDKAWLKLMIEQNRDTKLCIVTHFIPSYTCIHERWKTFGSNMLNYYFSANCDDLIGICEPGTSWIFGHTHDKREMKLGEVNLYCNPYGYPGENKTYEDMAIEI